MNKQQFLMELKSKLKSLPITEVDKSAEYYSEIIDDKVEEGLTEEQAVAGIGGVDKVAEQIIKDTPLHKILKEKVKINKSGTTVLLLIIGFPLWFPLLIAFAVVFLAVMISLFAVGLSLAIVCVIFCIYGIGNLLLSPMLFATSLEYALMNIGLDLILIGTSLLLYKPCLKICKLFFAGLKNIYIKIKMQFIKREEF